MLRGNYAHAAQLLSLCSRAWEPQLLNPLLLLLTPRRCRARAPQQEKPPQREAHALQLEKSPNSNTDSARPNKQINNH